MDDQDARAVHVSRSRHQCHRIVPLTNETTQSDTFQTYSSRSLSRLITSKMMSTRWSLGAGAVMVAMIIAMATRGRLLWRNEPGAVPTQNCLLWRRVSQHRARDWINHRGQELACRTRPATHPNGFIPLTARRFSNNTAHSVRYSLLAPSFPSYESPSDRTRGLATIVSRLVLIWSPLLKGSHWTWPQ